MLGNFPGTGSVFEMAACNNPGSAGLSSSEAHENSNIFTIKIFFQVRVAGQKLCKYLYGANKLVLQCILFVITGCSHDKPFLSVPKRERLLGFRAEVQLCCQQERLFLPHGTIKVAEESSAGTLFQ